MSKYTILNVVFSLIIGLGLGYSIGINRQPIVTDKVEMTQNNLNTRPMALDLGENDEQFDEKFLNAMILHHEGALDMADQAMKKSQRPEILKLAHDIVTAQNQEIELMKEWRKNWYGN
jgi:uncharacterized protein (DUF305 family)